MNVTELFTIMEFTYYKITPITLPQEIISSLAKTIINTPEKIMVSGFGTCTHYAMVMKYLCELAGHNMSHVGILTDTTSHSVLTDSTKKIYDPTLNVYYDSLDKDSPMYHRNELTTIDEMMQRFGQDLDLEPYDLSSNPYSRWKYRKYDLYTLKELLKGDFKISKT